MMGDGQRKKVGDCGFVVYVDCGDFGVGTCRRDEEKKLPRFASFPETCRLLLRYREGW